MVANGSSNDSNELLELPNGDDPGESSDSKKLAKNIVEVDQKPDTNIVTVALETIPFS